MGCRRAYEVASWSVGVGGGLKAFKVKRWHRCAWFGEEGATPMQASFDGAPSAAEPFALSVDFMAHVSQCVSGVE